MQQTGSSHKSHRSRRADWATGGAHTSSTVYGDKRYFDEASTSEPATLDKNDKQVDTLREKLRGLKDITVDIGHEIRDQNSFLSQMNSDFENTGNALAGTMKRFYRMAKTQSGAHMWLLCGFAIAVCIFLYLYLKWSS
ncbi:protein transport protein bet1 [Dimargaris cristalligena]|uniref:t-SNARE coiled-coil homology domain-containing protein n=1 Tax=Dimargaris cristalligena TaxID=215637 RepID=A0A4Q0A2B2_9FUNG|nr:protein transport protein bet1 [Dimargaris cristalligena]RKP39968.1 hypothetical protein BJ085DRAFT_33692 [Dimargaris cristalligena]|eukprot:RKP39968.1 hypothetical protein BJ085DRAFT_33692 [Dimargaris cristalligena]